MQLLIKDFVNFIKFIEQLSTNTVDNYERDLLKFDDYLRSNQLEYDKLSIEDFRIYFAQLQLSQSSLGRHASSIRKFYQFLLNNREITYNPTDFLKVSQPKQKVPHYITHEEFKQLINFRCENPQDYLDMAILELLYGSGLRVSEASMLEFRQIFWEEKICRVYGKGQKVRIAPLSSYAVDAIQNYVLNARELWLTQKTEIVFIDKKGKPLSRHSIYNICESRAIKQGLTKKVTPHILRHSFASELINHGADLRVIQELLGHSDVATTQIYTHLDFYEKKRQYQAFHPGKNILEKKGDDSDDV